MPPSYHVPLSLPFTLRVSKLKITCRRSVARTGLVVYPKPNLTPFATGNPLFGKFAWNQYREGFGDSEGVGRREVLPTPLKTFSWRSQLDQRVGDWKQIGETSLSSADRSPVRPSKSVQWSWVLMGEHGVRCFLVGLAFVLMYVLRPPLES